ncbi:hypothetical protein K488DRAFT_39597 [Vararia minispora EC-137]|uniref:Uncharacterized protein n=1 Tax=Vararia minispora EC-137 TaxID=1314806 RepID=A0ACB8R012_9AGAM|nr:hypothetical protein K488DRAFT_39597 [Vararia minispora EC-137]
MSSDLPPGLEGTLTETSSGGAGDWLAFDTKRWYTNAFIIEDHPTEVKILLGYKKRGFGVGLWNGFGGKVEPGETPVQAAIREMKEECDITAPLEHCGSLLFVLEGAPQGAFQIEVYRAATYTDTIAERVFPSSPLRTDEMRPQWFAAPKAVDGSVASSGLPPIPYDTMWDDDIHWMPLMLAGKKFVGRADFQPTTAGKYEMRRYWFGTPS